MTTSGVFDVTQLNAIRDAHVDWCAANSVDPKSALGEEAETFLLQALGVSGISCTGVRLNISSYALAA